MSAERIKRLSIIVPVYNEARTIEEVLARVEAVDLPLEKEIIVVDDASTDGTVQVLRHHEKRVVEPRNSRRIHFASINCGKGAALRLGIKHATGDYVLFQDADLELDPLKDYGKLLQPILSGQATVVYGRRNYLQAEGSHLSTKFGNLFMNGLASILYGSLVSDMATAYKCMPRELLESLDLRSNRFEIEAEITAKLLGAGHVIHEVPVEYSPRSYYQGKKIGYWDGIMMSLTLIRYWEPGRFLGGRPSVPALAPAEETTPPGVDLPLEGDDAATGLAGEPPASTAPGPTLSFWMVLLALMLGAILPSLVKFRAEINRQEFARRHPVRSPPHSLQQDTMTLERDGTALFERTLVTGAEAEKTMAGQLETELPLLDFRHVSVATSAGTTVPVHIGIDDDGAIEVELWPESPLSTGGPLPLALRARLHQALESSPSPERVRWRYPLLTARQAREEFVSLRLPPTVEPGAVVNIGLPYSRVETTSEGTTLHWKRTSQEAATQAPPVLEIDLPATFLTGEAEAVRWRLPLEAYGRMGALLAGVFGLIAWLLHLLLPGGVPRHAALLVLILVAMVPPLFQPRLVEDNFSYQAYTRSMVRDGDLAVWNDTYLHNSQDAYAPDPREAPGPMGVTLFLLPAFLLVDLLQGVETGTGFTSAHVIAVGLMQILYVVLGLLLIHRLVEKSHGPRVAFLALCGVAFGTNLLLMTYAWTANTHAVSFFLVSLFFYLWHETREARTLTTWFFMSLVAGVAIQTRHQNVLLLAVLAFDLGRHLFSPRRRDGMRLYLVLVPLGLAIGFLPQSACWWSIEDRAVLDLYGVSTGRFTDPLPRLGPMWVARSSTYTDGNGLFTANPILIPAVFGLLVVAVRCGLWGLLLLAFGLGQMLIVGSYEVWWGRLMFATPYLINCSLAFALGLAEFMRALQRLKLLWIGTLMIVAGALWNLRGYAYQQVYEQVDTTLRQVPLRQGLEALADGPSPLVSHHFMRYSSDFGLVLREVTERVIVGSGAMAIRCVFAMALFFLVLVACWHLPVLLRRRARPWVVGLSVLYVLVFSLLALRAGWRTDNDYTWQRRKLGNVRAEVRYGTYTLTPERRFEDSGEASDFPVQRVHLVTFMRGLRHVEQGASVARMTLVLKDGKTVNHTLRAGIETAAYDRDRPGSAPGHGPASPCQTWSCRDGSPVSYEARAYHLELPLPDPAEIETVGFEYLLDEGSFHVAMIAYFGKKAPGTATTPEAREPVP